jgi:hypothetical protein
MLLTSTPNGGERSASLPGWKEDVLHSAWAVETDEKKTPFLCSELI